MWKGKKGDAQGKNWAWLCTPESAEKWQVGHVFHGGLELRAIKAFECRGLRERRTRLQRAWPGWSTQSLDRPHHGSAAHENCVHACPASL